MSFSCPNIAMPAMRKVWGLLMNPQVSMSSIHLTSVVPVIPVFRPLMADRVELRRPHS